MRLSDCADVQANLRLCCSYTAKSGSLVSGPISDKVSGCFTQLKIADYILHIIY